MIKKLFAGRRKILTIPLLIGLATYAWPFLLGALLIYLATKIRYNAVKYIAMVLIFIFSLPFGAAWVLAMSGQTTPTTEQKEVAGENTVANSPTPTNTPSPTETPSPTTNITEAPTPTKSIPTPTKYVAPTIAATKVPTQPALQPTQPPVQSDVYTCDCGKTCTQISSCAEAQYQLNACGCSIRDNDNDGTACDAAPLNCQN